MFERDEAFYHAKNRARAAIVRARDRGWPLDPDEHEQTIGLIRCHTGAPEHVVQCAYDEALAELVEELDRCS